MAHARHETHGAPGEPRRHLWVIGIIAASAAAEVFATWTGLGGVAGFPVIHVARLRLGLGWTLATGTEAYAGYALWTWLMGAPGERSRKYAMSSALGSLGLSLIGQVAYHLMLASGRTRPPTAVVAFVACLPVVVLMLAAVMAHLVHADASAAQAAEVRRAAAERQAAIERAEADERTALRAGLDAAREELVAERAARTEAQRNAALRAEAEAARNEAQAALDAERAARAEADATHGEALAAAETAREGAERQAADAEAKAARLTRKLEANGTRKPGAKAAAQGRSGTRTTVPSDVDARAEALRILADNPNISGAKLGEACGMSERWGQLRKGELAEHVANGGAGE